MKDAIIIILAVAVLALSYGYITPEEAKEKIEEGKAYIEERI